MGKVSRMLDFALGEGIARWVWMGLIKGRKKGRGVSFIGFGVKVLFFREETELSVSSIRVNLSLLRLFVACIIHAVSEL